MSNGNLVLHWAEVYDLSDEMSAPKWSLASRSDSPPKNRAEAASSLIDFAFKAPIHRNINSEIDRKLKDLTRWLKKIMSNHRTGGVIAVACTLYKHKADQQLGPNLKGGWPARLLYVSLVKGGAVYGHPSHGISVFRNTPELYMPRRFESLKYRYFWGHWIQASNG